MSAPILRCTHLSKQVRGPEGTLDLLRDINLDILPGESIAVVGPSGAGKSTLLGLLAGLDTPSSGRIHFADTDITQLDEDGRAQLRAGRIGFVFQSFQLLAGLTALENVMLPLELAGGTGARPRALDLLDQVGLAERTRHYPHQLSGGEQQRVALARAFASEPQILFADEPTGNLDQRTGESLSALLFRLNQERATTLVLVTHDEQLAARCHRVIHLNAGRLESQS